MLKKASFVVAILSLLISCSRFTAGQRESDQRPRAARAPLLPPPLP